MKVVFFGTPQFAVPCLKRLLETAEFKVVAVVTQPDKPRGRGKQLIPSPVKEVALAHQLPVWQPKRIKKSAETIEQLRQTAADYFVVVAYGQILSQEILDLPRGGCINNHGSILPEYRGAAPIQWSIYNGETETGITTMLMDAGMDTGAMLLKARTEISLLENSQQLAERIASIGADLLVETLLKFDRGEIEPIPQDNARATYAPLIQKSDFNLDFTRSAIALHNQIRAFSPNCVARWREQLLKILATVPLDEQFLSQLPSEYASLQQRVKELSPPTAQPGEVVGLIKKFGAIVQTGDGLLLLREVQLAGKRPQQGWDFVNGMRLQMGEVFESPGRTE